MSEGSSHSIAGVPIPRAAHLGRYKDIAKLVIRHHDAPSVRHAGVGYDSPATEDEREKARQFAEDLESMGPTFVKLGQLLSSRPDLLPPVYLEELGRLREKVEPFDWEQVEEIVESELGVRISKGFRDFEQEPLAAASLGQVHRAVLRDGRAVAVKVQRPGIDEVISKDLEVLGDLAAFADEHTEMGRRYAVATMMDEFRQALLSELDYREEARNLVGMAEDMAHFRRIRVPAPVDDFTGRRVLTMDLVSGRSLGRLSPLARLEIDGHRLLDQLYHAYLEQAFVSGLLHADPHPGNVFLTSGGDLALIDLGMVLHIPGDVREHILRIVVAIASGDGKEAARLTEEMGHPLPDYDREGYQHTIGTMVTRADSLPPSDESNLGRLVMGLARAGADHGLRPPRELTLIGKTLLHLDGIAAILDPRYDPREAVRTHAVGMTARTIMQDVTPGAALRAALDAKDFAEALPRRINRALDAVGDQDLEIRVRLLDDADYLKGFQQMANRITTGLVLAALIVGAALLMNIETPLTLLGYPILAIVFFLAAAAGGVILVYKIWQADRKARREAARQR